MSYEDAGMFSEQYCSSVLCVIGEQFPDWTQAEQRASAALLATALNSYLLGHLTEAPAHTEL